MTQFLVGLTRDLMDASGHHPSVAKRCACWKMIPQHAGSFLANLSGRSPRGACPLRRDLRQRAVSHACRLRRGSGRTRLIASHGVGYDSVDVAACNEPGRALHYPAGWRSAAVGGGGADLRDGIVAEAVHEGPAHPRSAVGGKERPHGHGPRRPHARPHRAQAISAVRLCGWRVPSACR
jgi:hypothetical protein